MPISEFQHVGFIRCVGERGETVPVHEFRAVSLLPTGERRFRPERRYRLESGDNVHRDEEGGFQVTSTGYRLTLRETKQADATPLRGPGSSSVRG